MPNYVAQTVLAAPSLCGRIQETKSRLRNVLPGDPVAKTGFYRRLKAVDRNVGSFFRVRGTREVSKRVAYGGPAQDVSQRNVELVSVVLNHTKEKLTLNMADFMGIFKKESDGSKLMIDQKGVDEIRRQNDEFRARFDNLRQMMIAYSLSAGAVYFDSSGNLLPSSAGAYATVSQQIPTGNANQLIMRATPPENPNLAISQGTPPPIITQSGGAIIDTSWDNSTADIKQQITNLFQTTNMQTGYKPKYALYSATTEKRLTDNPKVASHIIRDVKMNEAYLKALGLGSTEGVFQLFGLTWVPAFEAFYVQNTGAYNVVWPDDLVVFTPDPDDEGWFGWLEGTYPVPNNIGTVHQDALESLADITLVEGMFEHSNVLLDPPTIQLIAGDTSLPVFMNPYCVQQAMTVFQGQPQ